MGGLHEWPLHLRQLRLESIEGLAVPIDGEPLNIIVNSGSLKEHAHSELGLAGLLGERGRHLKFRARHVVEDDPFWLHDLDKSVSRSSREEFHQDRRKRLWMNVVSLAIQRPQLGDWDRLTERLGRL
jgi:hypothetical protein